MIDNILHLYKDFYYSLPQTLVSFLGSVYGSLPIEFRFGRPYRFHSDFVRRYEQWDSELQTDFLFYKTLEVLIFAERHIPFYQRSFAEHGFRTSEFKTLADLARVPVLTKDDINKNLEILHTFTRDKGTAYYTGGSTSVPMRYYLPLSQSRSKEKAYMNYIFSKVGYSPRDRVILLKGRDVAIPDRSIFWQHEPVDNYLVLSSNYLDERHGHALLRRASEFKPRFYFGFPSAVLDYIKMARRIGVHGVSGIRAVFLTSENVFAEQRQEIRDFFQCDVLCQFGHTERSAFAYRLNDGAYKFISSYGLCRSVDNGIVATGFDNFVMPFINYELNDYVSEDREVHSQYDILLSSGEIEGRIQEFLVTGDARLISICSMGAGHFSALHDIEAIQYHQKAPGRATFRVQAPDAGLVDSQGIKEQLEEQSNFSIEFDIEFVDKIDKSTRGKRIMCVQELNIDEIRRSRAAALAAASAALAAPQPPTQQAHA